MRSRIALDYEEPGSHQTQLLHSEMMDRDMTLDSIASDLRECQLLLQQPEWSKRRSGRKEVPENSILIHSRYSKISLRETLSLDIVRWCMLTFWNLSQRIQFFDKILSLFLLSPYLSLRLNSKYHPFISRLSSCLTLWMVTSCLSFSFWLWARE